MRNKKLHNKSFNVPRTVQIGVSVKRSLRNKTCATKTVKSYPFCNYNFQLHSFRGREPGRLHETLMIAKHETSIDFYGASERWI